MELQIPEKYKSVDAPDRYRGLRLDQGQYSTPSRELTRYGSDMGRKHLSIE